MRELKATIREGGKSLGTLRSTGSVPAVLYGPDVTALALSVPRAEFEHLFSEVGESSLLRLEVSDGKGSTSRPFVVLIRDVQRDPVRNTPRHLDFHAVRMNETLRIEVPIRFVGASSVESKGEGVVVKDLHEIEIEALPENLPHEIEVDVSQLIAVNQAVTVASVPVPKGVRLLAEEDLVIVRTAPLISEAEIEALETPPEESVESVELAGEKGGENDEGENEDASEAEKTNAEE